jgi:hypothetical protein
VGAGERAGVADGLSLGVGELFVSGVAIGEGKAPILGTGVGTGYLPLTSAAPPRVINHAIRTPEAASTSTIANTHGSTLLLDSPLVSSDLACF